MKTFQNELYQDETVINYINFPIYRGLFNVGFSKKNKKENREAAIALGVGLQKYAIKEDILLAHSALEFRNIKNKEVDYTNPLVQLTSRKHAGIYITLELMLELKRNTQS